PIPELRNSWFTTTVMGMCVLIAWASVQLLIGLPFTAVSVPILCVGVILSLKPTRIALQRNLSQPRKPFEAVLEIIFWGSLVFRILTSFCNFNFNCYDDFLAYIPQAKMILQTGKLLD